MIKQHRLAAAIRRTMLASLLASTAWSAQAQDAPGKEGRDLAAALFGRHGGGVACRVVDDGRESFGRRGRWHCGLLSGVPTTAFAWRPVRCLAG